MWKKLLKKLLESAVFRKFRQATKRIKPPGFEGISLYGIFVFLIDSFKKGNYSIRAAAISFRFFIALFPTLLVFLSLIPRIPIPGFQEELLQNIQNILPAGSYQFIESTVEDLLLKKHDVMMSVGFVLAFYFASEGMNALLSGFDRSYQLSTHRNPFVKRLVAFWLLIVFMVVVTLAVSILIISEQLLFPLISDAHYLITGAFDLVKWIVVIFVFITGVSFLYNTGNPGRKKWKLISAGATLATTVIILASIGLKYYISNFSAYNELYGSIASLIILMIWINISSLVLLIGFELYANIEKRSNELFEKEQF